MSDTSLSPQQTRLLQEVTQELDHESNQFRASRLQKLKALIETGIAPYPSTFKKTHELAEVIEKYTHLENGQETEDLVTIAGRIMTIRNSGMFIDLQDPFNKVQVFSHKDYSPETVITLVKLLDIADHIGVTGFVRRTPRGELTVNVQEITFLGKALLPLPEKYHGLNDVELCYRQRYLDLIMNQESRLTLRKRSEITSAIRSYLIEAGFFDPGEYHFHERELTEVVTALSDRDSRLLTFWTDRCLAIDIGKDGKQATEVKNLSNLLLSDKTTL